MHFAYKSKRSNLLFPCCVFVQYLILIDACAALSQTVSNQDKINHAKHMAKDIAFNTYLIYTSAMDSQ